MADRYEEGLRALRDAPAPDQWWEVRERSSTDATPGRASSPATSAVPLARLTPTPGNEPRGRFPRSFRGLVAMGGALATLLAVVVFAGVADSDDVTATEADQSPVGGTQAGAGTTHPATTPSTSGAPAPSPPPSSTPDTSAEATTTTVASPPSSVASSGSTRPRMPPANPPHEGGPGTVPASEASPGLPTPAGCRRVDMELDHPPPGWHDEMQHDRMGRDRIPAPHRGAVLGAFVSDDPARLAVVTAGPSPMATEALTPIDTSIRGTSVRVGPFDGGWQAEVELSRRRARCVVTVFVFGTDEDGFRRFVGSLAPDVH